MTALSRTLLLLLLGLLWLCVSCGGTSAEPGPTDEPVASIGTQLATSYVTMLHDHNVDGLRGLLADAFMMQRPDGTSVDKAGFLADLPVLAQGVLPVVQASRGSETLVLIWQTPPAVVAAATSGDIPRISTYIWDHGAWRLLSQGDYSAGEAPPD